MMIKQDQPAMPAFEFSPEEPAALTPSGSPNALTAVTRQEIDLQIATAKRYPRSISAFLNACKAQATIDPEVAQSLFYSVPVGKGPNGRQAYADGPSIRMAEMVAANYRNLRFSTDIVDENDKAVTARATVMDLIYNSRNLESYLDLQMSKSYIIYHIFFEHQGIFEQKLNKKDCGLQEIAVFAIYE